MNQQQKKIRRQEQILLRLDKLNFATRKQLQVIENLGGDRNAHRILHEMEKDKLISSLRQEQKIYFLTNRGKQQIGSNKGDLKKDNITHALLQNDLYIKLDMPNDWVKEQPIKWGENKLIPDATFIKNSEYHFVEIDNQQSLKVNYEKIEKYKSLSKAIFNSYKHHPVLIWYTLSDVRKRKLEEACIKHGIKFKIY